MNDSVTVEYFGGPLDGTRAELALDCWAVTHIPPPGSCADIALPQQGPILRLPKYHYHRAPLDHTLEDGTRIMRLVQVES